MKKLLKLFVPLLLLSLMACSESSGRWGKVIDNEKLAHPVFFAAFLDESNGITVGYSGECHYTSDSGKTWPKAENKSACRYGADYVTKDLIWNTGNKGNVRVSRDGGKTWSAVTDLPVKNISPLIKFVSDKDGWVSNKIDLWSTIDGGKTWNDMKKPEGIGNIVELSIKSGKEGYIIEDKGNIYHTANAGTAWEKIPIKLQEKMKLASLEHSSIFVPGKENEINIITTMLGGGSFKIIEMTTKDKGATWKSKELPLEYGEFYISRDGRYLTVFKTNLNLYKRETGA